MNRRIVSAGLGAMLAELALGRAAGAGEAGSVAVVATFTILADLVRAVGGGRVTVTSLVGPDSDAHGFQPAPADAARVAGARLVVANGLGFDGWAERLVKASGQRPPPLVLASRGVRSIIAPPHGHSHSREADPHAFQSVANVRTYVANIRDGLAAADPDGREAYAAGAAAYGSELDRLETEIKAELAGIPAERRRVITSHDAFGYFAAAYGIRFVAPRGVSADSDVSARDVAAIVRQIKAEKIPAVFLENVSDPRLMERIAAESGARIGGKLYSDALSGPDGAAPTYLALMRSNVRTLAAALKP